MTQAICPICQHSLQPFSEEIKQCSYCGLGITTQQPLQTGDYHRDGEYISEHKLFQNIFARRVSLIEKYHPKKGRVLEIGSSTGELLSILKDKGWEVLGIELSAKAAKIAQGRKIPTQVLPFEQFKNSGKFDVVIINHTLEHLKNPKQIIQKISELLLSGGLVLISVPNFGSLSAKLQRQYWPLLLPDEHLWHFTAHSLGLLLSQYQLSPIYTEQISGIWDMQNPMKELVISLTQLKKRFFTEVVGLIPSLITTKLNKGSNLTIVAQKQ